MLFIGIGMLAGSDGPGGLAFDNFDTAKSVGNIALAFILFAGGLESTWASVRPVLWRGLSLSTVGVAVTFGLVGAFAHFVLGLPWTVGLLLGAIVASTDAAAVFGVLRSSGARLKHRVSQLLELESGTNDPVAAFLTIAMTEVAMRPATSLWEFVPRLLVEMPLGVAVGLASGTAAATVMNRIRLEYVGLYSVITVSTVLFAFGGSTLIHANPYLAVYVAGLTMGSRNFLHRQAILQFHDAIAWITQIVMFVVLGLLVYPSRLPGVAGPGLAVALFLIFVARPAAVFASLAFTRMKARSKLFISLAGLRGAVPIIFATFPALAGVPQAQLLFDLVFFIVITSVVVQATLMRPMAVRLKVAAPVRPHLSDLKPAAHDELLEIAIAEGSRVVGKQVVDLGLPQTALIVLLTRGSESYIPRGSTVLEPDDVLLIATRKKDQAELRKLIEEYGPQRR